MYNINVGFFYKTYVGWAANTTGYPGLIGRKKPTNNIPTSQMATQT
jgi:hypothetical protein